MGLVSWMYLHLRADVHSGTRTQYRSLQTPSRYPFSSSPRVNINSEMQVHPADESQTGRNARPGFHC
ncbi:unnamed protein product [Schistosoma margrebowiei]|uniref:Uncharacterized protein n=1 Tax=Schistosoma margrebowiei TaxID=48269 RepID=A0A3P7Z1Z5_9TREM|nr:unnamed protein product [Schistosoma margrebowiei]